MLAEAETTCAELAATARSLVDGKIGSPVGDLVNPVQISLIAAGGRQVLVPTGSSLARGGPFIRAPLVEVDRSDIAARLHGRSRHGCGYS